MNTSLLRKSVAKTTIGLLIASRTYRGAEEQIMRLLQQQGIDNLILNPCFSTDEKGDGTQEESYFAFEISYSKQEEEEALANIIKHTHMEFYLIPNDRNDVVEVIKKKQEGKLFFRGESVKEGEYAVIQQIADEFASWYRLGIQIKEDMNLTIAPFTDEMTVGERITPVVKKENMKEIMTTLFDMMDAKLLPAEDFLYRRNPLEDCYEIFVRSDVKEPKVQVPDVQVLDEQVHTPKGDYEKWTVNWVLESGGHYNLPFESAKEAFQQVQELEEAGVDRTLITIFEPQSNISLELLEQYAEKNE